MWPEPLAGMAPRGLILRVSRRFDQAGIPDPVTDAALLLSRVTGRPPLALRLDMDSTVPPETLAEYLRLCEARLRRIPLQHLTGLQAFCGRDFRTDGRALIPRPETELLALRAEEKLRERPGGAAGAAVLDLCCGTGCIGLTVALDCPGAEVTCADLSGEALSLARENAAALGASVRFAPGDLFGAVGEAHFDAILSNPPYIPSGDCPGLQPEVLHDPLMALDGGPDGLSFYRRIAGEAAGHLRPGGFLLLEAGDGQAEAVEGLLAAGGLTDIRTHPDLAGLPRMVEAHWSGHV